MEKKGKLLGDLQGGSVPLIRLLLRSHYHLLREMQGIAQTDGRTREGKKGSLRNLFQNMQHLGQLDQREARMERTGFS